MKKILKWVSVNGKIILQEQATVSVFDYGFLCGMGVFTTLKVREGVPLFFEKHVERLEKSVKQLFLTYSWITFNDVINVIKKNKVQDGGVRITITPNMRVIHAMEITKEVESVSVITITDTRDQYKTLKMTYRVPHFLAQQKAREQGVQDALFVQNNFFVESTYANIFSLSSGKIITPPIENRGLNGISRQVLMEELPVEEKEIVKDTTDPMVLVSCLSMRVVEKIDRREIKQDRIFVEKIKNAMDKMEREYLSMNK